MVDRRVPGSDVTYVSRSEVKAAQMKVELLLARGEQPSKALLAIANARHGASSNGVGPGRS